MSQFVVSARKYRPATFDEVVGQNHIARTLTNALQTNHLAHAFLFCGPRGVGKTTCARILAKVLNCENLQDAATPCNTCGSCTAFNNNASFNIIELDAASNNSVNDMRNLIEQVRFQPQEGKYKIFIIDEVHMLSTQAFNAFLKTLEEPPSYGIFILATTEKHKIIPTILSRCQIFDFKRIQVEDIVSQLQSITASEDRTAEYEALHIIAQKADGAMRDALSIYDKIASASSSEITYQDVIENLNILDYDYYFRITDAFLQQDLAQVMLILDDTVSKGFDVEQTMQGLSEHLRDLMVCKSPETIQLLNTTAALKERYANQANLATKAFLLSGLNILNQADIYFPRAKNKRLHVEIALSKITYISQRLSTSLIEEKKTKVVSATPAVATTTAVPKQSIPTTAETSEEKIVSSEPSNTTSSSAAIPLGSATKSEPASTPISINIPSASDQKVIDTPRLSSTADLLLQVQEIEKQQVELKKNLNVETIQHIWDDYTEHNESPSVKQALKMANLHFADKTVTLTVPGTFFKDVVQQETALLDRMRNETGTPNLVFNVVVDKDAFPEYEEAKPKKILSNADRYQLMKEKNPLLDKLRDTFLLEVDKG